MSILEIFLVDYTPLCPVLSSAGVGGHWSGGGGDTKTYLIQFFGENNLYILTSHIFTNN